MKEKFEIYVGNSLLQKRIWEEKDLQYILYFSKRIFAVKISNSIPLMAE